MSSQSHCGIFQSGLHLGNLQSRSYGLQTFKMDLECTSIASGVERSNSSQCRHFRTRCRFLPPQLRSNDEHVLKFVSFFYSSWVV